MRLSPADIATIRNAAAEVFGADAVVRLFGSRVDDGLRGGDIDLHVCLPPGISPTLALEFAFRDRLCEGLGDQKLDIVLQAADRGDRAIDAIARETGVRL